MVTLGTATSVRLPRITPVSILLELKLGFDAAAQLNYLYDVFGIVTAFKQGDDGKGSGPFVQFRGNFVAVPSPQVGSVEFVSKRCHLTPELQGAVITYWAKAMAIDPDAQLSLIARIGARAGANGSLIQTSYFGTLLQLPEPFNELQAIRNNWERSSAREPDFGDPRNIQAMRDPQ
jgi:hypothetical protein